MPEVGSRRSGFTLPTNTFQIVSWVLYAFFNATFYGLLFLSLDIPGMAVAGALFGVFSIVVAVAAILATAVDPADPAIYNPSNTNLPPSMLQGKLYCNKCDVYVHESSKHCSTCKKCVHRFDHHCVWLNTCVGSSTYRCGKRVCAFGISVLRL
jgi:hypothetical protein